MRTRGFEAVGFDLGLGLGLGLWLGWSRRGAGWLNVEVEGRHPSKGGVNGVRSASRLGGAIAFSMHGPHRVPNGERSAQTAAHAEYDLSVEELWLEESRTSGIDFGRFRKKMQGANKEAEYRALGLHLLIRGKAGGCLTVQFEFGGWRLRLRLQWIPGRDASEWIQARTGGHKNRAEMTAPKFGSSGPGRVGAEAGTNRFLFLGAYDSRHGWLGKDSWKVALEMNLKESEMVVRSKPSVIAGGACMNDDVSLLVIIPAKSKDQRAPNHEEQHRIDDESFINIPYLAASTDAVSPPPPPPRPWPAGTSRDTNMPPPRPLAPPHHLPRSHLPQHLTVPSARRPRPPSSLTHALTIAPAGKDVGGPHAIFPVHAVVLAAHCAALPRLPCPAISNSPRCQYAMRQFIRVIYYLVSWWRANPGMESKSSSLYYRRLEKIVVFISSIEIEVWNEALLTVSRYLMVEVLANSRAYMKGRFGEFGRRAQGWRQLNTGVLDADSTDSEVVGTRNSNAGSRGDLERLEKVKGVMSGSLASRRVYLETLGAEWNACADAMGAIIKSVIFEEDLKKVRKEDMNEFGCYLLKKFGPGMTFRMRTQRAPESSPHARPANQSNADASTSNSTELPHADFECPGATERLGISGRSFGIKPRIPEIQRFEQIRVVVITRACMHNDITTRGAYRPGIMCTRREIQNIWDDSLKFQSDSEDWRCESSIPRYLQVDAEFPDLCGGLDKREVGAVRRLVCRYAKRGGKVECPNSAVEFEVKFG
ncbi:hypothetical protein C8R44DRAFT_754741 [Mycena epipterygia]|nr:hypothetical protein C8R44DRAFT_754741 [Mycena epipterygia]